MGVLSGTKLERFSHLKMELCYPENSRVDFFFAKRVCDNMRLAQFNRIGASNPGIYL